MATVELPSWLTEQERYEPTGARHRVMQKNVLHLASLLERVRLGGGAHKGGSMVDRALSSFRRRCACWACSSVSCACVCRKARCT